MTELRDAHVLVTGASRGLGKRIAVALAAQGARLTLAARTADQLRPVADEIGGGTRAVAADVSDTEQRAALVERAQSEGGPIDILVNNAGVEWASAFADQDPDEITQTLQVNLVGAMLLTRAVLPTMVERRRGHVVNMASLSGLSGTPYEAAYSASKFGLVGFSQALRAELRGSGVSCSVICPGFVADDGMYARMAQRGATAPRMVGVSSIEKVVDSVVATIRSDDALVIVNPSPMRPLLALQTLVPAAHGALMQRFGLTGMFRRVVEDRRSS
jgi:short-subunit dehydrogenase